MEFSLLEAKASRMVLTALLWKLQRVLANVPGVDVAWLEQLGAPVLSTYQQQALVTRRNNKVVLA